MKKAQMILISDIHAPIDNMCFNRHVEGLIVLLQKFEMQSALRIMVFNLRAFDSYITPKDWQLVRAKIISSHKAE